MSQQLVPIEALTNLSGWDKLPASEQKEVQRETQALAHSILDVGHSRLAVGQHLTSLKAILEPKRMFSKYLKIYRLNRSTAYQHIAAYKNAKSTLPEAVLNVAMARGYNMLGNSEDRPLGVYTDAVKALPPPKTENVIEIETWLGKVEEKRKKIRPVSGRLAVAESPETLMKECYRFFAVRFNRLPANHKTRMRWTENLIGMMLSQLGVSGSKTFGPSAVPDGFRAVRGRPPLEAAA
jgi:hypothetical protein